MCFHTKTTTSIKDLEEKLKVVRNHQFEISDNDFYHFHLNGYSHPEMLIIPQEDPSILNPSIWGLMPRNEEGIKRNDYYKKAVKWGGGLNAQSEKMFEHFLYKYSAFERRCLIPVDGFYEPHTAPNKLKIPFLFQRKNKAPFCLAGLYQITKDGFVTMTILTRKASPLFAKIHNTKFREPVMLNYDIQKEWLRNDLIERSVNELINIPYDYSELETYPVSRDLFSPKVNSDYIGITDKVEYKELNTLL